MMCGNSCWSCEWWFYKHLQDSDSSEVRTLSLTQLGVGKALTFSTCNFVHCLASIWNWYGSCLSYLVQEYILHADSTWQDSIIYGLIISLISVLFDDLFSLCPSLIILFLNIGTPHEPSIYTQAAVYAWKALNPDPIGGQVVELYSTFACWQVMHIL